MWTTWSGELSCSPARRLRPRSVDEVAAAVADGPGPVRVAGAGHSFTPLCLTGGTLLELDGALRGVQDADPATGLVRVGAGTTLHEVNVALDELGLAFANLGDIDVQAVAGAISTSTHGTGGAKPSLAGQVEALELMAADGTLHRCGRDDDPDLWRAARVSLGALGVLTSVTVRAVPAFTLRRVDRPEPLEEVLGALDERVAAHEHFELFAFPYARDALTRTTDRVDGPPRP
ncbi:MAG TPA: FAD-binding protein, partial [Baekduia sp.]|nr:FAD-binding protein [Baekduia sp.]